MTLSVGLIGCGFIGAFHSRNIKDIQSRGLADVRYQAVCDRDRARAERFAALAGVPLVADRAEEVIEQCDAVYVCTETAEHPALVAAAARAGKHVFCEKPLATDLAAAEAMARQVTDAGIVHQVGLVLRFSPVYRVLEEWLAESSAPVLTAHLRDDQCFPVDGQYGSTWRADVHRAGGGTLLEHSIHDVDLLRRLFGPIVRVRCHTRNLAGHPGIEDVAVVTFHHAGGHQSTLTSVWHGVTTRPSSRHLEVFCADVRLETHQDYFGTLTIEHGAEPAVTLSNDEVLARFMAAEALQPRREDLRSLAALCDRRFLEAAIAGRPASPSFDDALVAHRIVDACYRSAAEDRDVALEDPLVSRR
ncbi:MAG TPA: Gfo/Idh/MocA family oxidoreductase [Pseudomonadales bacterium]